MDAGGLFEHCFVFIAFAVYQVGLLQHKSAITGVDLDIVAMAIPTFVDPDFVGLHLFTRTRPLRFFESPEGREMQ